MATSNTSASMVCAPVFSPVTVTFTPLLPTSVFSTFVAGEHLDAAFGETLLQRRADLLVLDGQDARHHLHDGHLRAERVVEIPELHADGPRAHDDHALGLFGERHGVARADDGRPVKGQVRQRARGGAGGEQDAPGGMRLFLAVGGF